LPSGDANSAIRNGSQLAGDGQFPTTLKLSVRDKSRGNDAKHAKAFFDTYAKEDYSSSGQWLNACKMACFGDFAFCNCVGEPDVWSVAALHGDREPMLSVIGE
jgi:hypothetical protein